MNFVVSGVSSALHTGAWAVGAFLRYVPLRFLSGAAFALACKHPQGVVKTYTAASQILKDVSSSLPCSKAVELLGQITPQLDRKDMAIAVGSAIAYDNITSSKTVRYVAGALAVWGCYSPESVRDAALALARCLVSDPRSTGAGLAGIAALLAGRTLFHSLLNKLSPDPKEDAPKKPKEALPELKTAVSK